ncbi:MAG: hypothetical protein GXN93_02455 [Candidatus Diapherotrites archaeon]|nr:hypothetical protein [Candidatus Diapherotrites archaeon]
MRPIVVIDTNMLLAPFQFGVDVISEIQRLVPGAQIFVLRGTIRELDRVAKQGVKEKKYAQLAKKLITINGIQLIDRDGPVDTLLVELASKGAYVATNDRELRRRIREVGGHTLFLREKNRLEMD